MKKTILLITIIFLTIFISIGEAIEVSAQITNPAIDELGGNTPESYQEASSGQTLLAQFVRLWANAMTIGALLVIVYFLWGAMEWILSAGDTGKLDKARQRMMHAALGMIILVSSYVILGFISSLLFGENFDLFDLEFFTPGS